jgi:transcriptional regulator of acetoin/glycerol metabolism
METVSSDVLKVFLKYPWPGNIRWPGHTMTARNKAKAARFPGMDRVTLYRKIKRYNLNKDTP